MPKAPSKFAVGMGENAFPAQHADLAGPVSQQFLGAPDKPHEVLMAEAKAEYDAWLAQIRYNWKAAKARGKAIQAEKAKRKKNA